jgi:hypothetical protein
MEVPEPTVKVIDAEDADAVKFPESSMPLALIVYTPLPGGVQVYVQLDVPFAGDQVTPPSKEISTPAMVFASVAVPVMVTGNDELVEELFAGDVITVTGAVTSVDALAAVNPVCRVAG